MSQPQSNSPTTAPAVLSPLTAISPLDGRYHQATAACAEFASEYALIRYRVQVEVNWLLHLAQCPEITEMPNFSSTATRFLHQLYQNFSLDDANAVKKLEQQTNHDVKAVEYWLREQCHSAEKTIQAELIAAIPFIHFACTSEDINNTAYALMQRDLQQSILGPQLQTICDQLHNTAQQYASQAMLARTHGQAASPTTLGKEIKVFASRLEQTHHELSLLPIYAKFNGAVGNYHAHLAAYPDLDWAKICSTFIEKTLQLTVNPHTTQIEPHDHLCAWLQILQRANNILTDFCRDMWGYISLGYLQQTPISGEVGSSTMPHKINPIDFENAEGNLGLANAMAQYLVQKLPISRWQRDLSDSTSLRNLGSIVAYSNLAYRALLRGLNKVSPDAELINRDLASHWEVLTEAVQSVMRRHGIADAYEQLKSFSRGQAIDAQQLRQFIQQLQIPETAKQQLLQLKPMSYLGNAVTQATNHYQSK